MNHKDNISDYLKKTKTENLFVTPDSYFEDLPNKITERVSGRETGQSSSFFFRILQKPVYLISISVMVLILISIIIFPINKHQTNTDFFANISVEELFEDPDFLINELNEFDLIEGLITYEDSYSTVDFEDEEIIEDDIINYLIESDSDNELIYDL